MLESLWKIILNDSDVKEQEKNEVISYEASLLRESGQPQELLTLLTEKKGLFLDKLYYQECLLHCHSEMGNTEKAI